MVKRLFIATFVAISPLLAVAQGLITGHITDVRTGEPLIGASVIVKSDLSLIGLDLKKDLEKSFSDNGTLDEILLLLENGKPAEVAVEKVGISFNNADEAVNRFLQWILENGTKYNHEYGLLNLDNKETNDQIHKVQNTLTAQK